MRIRLAAAILLAGLLVGTGAARAQDDQWHHGMSLLGEVKYPAGYKHFDSVNPDAPKGGTVRLGYLGAFDTLNPLPTGALVPATGQHFYQSLFTASPDEPSVEYGEIAEAVKYPADFSTATFRLRAEARWHDGKPITAEDVVWSFDAWKKHNILQANYYNHVVKAEVTGEREVTFTFDKPGNRELPHIIGQLVILPKHWWTANGADGKPRDIGKSTMEPPLGSGPYRYKSVNPGASVVLERVKDWWAADLPFAKGMHNFDEVRLDYFRDADVQREALKADAYDFRNENIAKDWMTAYDIDAVKNGRLVKFEVSTRILGRMQAFALNLRRAKFADPRVRQALNLSFDFESMNASLFYGLYKRIDSYFAGLDLASSGLPQGEELAILESIRDKVPPEVFTTPYVNPVNGTDEARRTNLRAAFQLLKQAGWEVRDRKLTHTATGEVMKVEILIPAAAAWERIALAWKQSLERLGIEVTVRGADPSQFEKRQNDRDFDLILFSQGQSQSPGNEQRDYWSSAEADRPGSGNIIGIKSPAVDALIDRVIFAKTREELVAATKALDRVLLAGHYVVPQWYSDESRLLRWNRFAAPATLPTQSLNGGFPEVWWFDKDLAARTGMPK